MGHWDQDPDFPVDDWKYEVSNDDTRLGYHDWVKSKHTDIALGYSEED